jgi:D-tagatose-1,6-bisphosphate aldolase subunit GatZ/KbaZ
MSEKHFLHGIVTAQKRGEARGIYSVCSANGYVVEAAILQGIEDGSAVLIEATCNQVNQFGGYTGYKPADFNRFVRERALALGLPEGRLILGGDHLGPYPFRGERYRDAMAKTIDMVRSYVLAGSVKLHIDASYRTADDGGGPDAPLSPSVIAERCGVLCRSAEEAFEEYAAGKPGARAPVYVIGTEVPAPGGSSTLEPDDRITKVADFEETVELAEKAFGREGIGKAWDRVVAAVVEPGVEHGDQTVLEYDRGRTGELSAAIAGHETLVFEAHTTDYQTAPALKRMVEDGFAILKTGQSMTAAAREAAFMLARVEEELFGGRRGFPLSNFVQTLDRAMVDNPRHWQGHYPDSGSEFQRKYSLFDRQRYYWTDDRVTASLRVLIENLRSVEIPLALVSQYMPEQYKKIRVRLLENDPEAMIRDRVMDHMREYSYAVGNRKAISDWWNR